MARATRFVTVAQSSVPTSGSGSDVTFVIPSGRAWQLGSIAVTAVTSAVVGNRQVDIVIADSGDNVVAKYVAGAVQAASLTRTYVFAPQHPQETAFAGGLMLRALAALQLPSGYKVRVYDSAAIDAAGDALTVRLLNEEMAE